jgi:DNA-binding response OmpR family regulator
VQHDRAAESSELIAGGVNNFWEVEDQERQSESVLVRPPTSYRQAFGDKPIRLGIVEFRILLFLASRPYHAFTRRQIADAMTANSLSVAEAAVDGHVATLRDQLGVLHDFVQSVPHVGYRYKA